MSDDNKTSDLHEVQTPKGQGERLEELGQRVMSPPPLDKVSPDDATKGQRVIPPAPLPETPQISPSAVPASPDTPQTLSAPTPTTQPSQPSQPTSSPQSSEDSS